MTGRLDSVITNIVEVFIEYAEEEGKGKKHKLSKEELKSVLDHEIQSSELKGEINTDDIEQAMEMLDKNHDGRGQLSRVLSVRLRPRQVLLPKEDGPRWQEREGERTGGRSSRLKKKETFR
uniref:S100/CaBP-9k-type calcium binding subdomain domain-containing protein n=1 Tax=Amphiprion percula TaxID=161767 RepID=A0A3P8RZI1_AMPPE